MAWLLRAASPTHIYYAETVSGGIDAFGFLAVVVVALLFFRPLNHRAAQHFCGNEFQWLIRCKTAKTASLPCGIGHRPPAWCVDEGA
jgi:hypothetical protein